VLAFNTTDVPSQIVVAPLAVMEAVGLVFTVTEVAVDIAEHPLLLETTTEYEPEVLAI
jgi:hypothetical protein